MNEFILVLPRLWPRYLGDPEHPFITKGGHYSSLPTFQTLRRSSLYWCRQPELLAGRGHAATKRPVYWIQASDPLARSILLLGSSSASRPVKAESSREH